jgi:predicted nuclease of restriction endonuclease-like (RecB) superfamily
MVESKLHLSQTEANKITNFKNTLPQITSDMAQAMLKDPYCLEFMGIHEITHERTLENGLVDNIRNFLLHLGKGFAFIANQYKLVVGGDEFFIDMLFFNTELNAYIVIELKTTKFSPSDVGQLSFYVKAVDRQVKKEYHGNTIGILLCQSKNEVVAEYSLEASQSPIGISQYELGKALTQHLKIHIAEKKMDDAEKK